MSKVVLISVAAALGLGLLSLHLVKQLKAGEATIADLQAQVGALQQQLRQAVPLPREASPPAEDIGPQPSEVIGTPPKEPPKTLGAITGPDQTSPAPPSRDDHMRMLREQRERQRQLLQDPEYREAMRVQARSNFASQYPGVIQELGLNPRQADEFFDLLAEQQLRAGEQMEPLWEMQGADPNDPAALQERDRKIQQQAQENQRRNEVEMAAYLGQDKLQAWQEYQSSMGMRYELENMRHTLSANGLPLNEEMSKPMLKALTQANQAEADEYSAAVKRGAVPASVPAGGNVRFDGSNLGRHLEIAKKRNQRMLDAISPYLSSQQRAAIEKQQEAQLKMQEAQLRLMRSEGKLDNDGVYFVESSAISVAQP